MDAEQLVNTQADPQPHVCEYCGETHKRAWSAARCCDPISNDLDTD